MKAIVRDRYGPPDVLRYEDRPPPAIGSGHVLVRVRAASLNTTDSDHLAGRPRAARVATGLRRPRSSRVGLDVAGTVEQAAPDVDGLRPGDDVWADLFEHGHGSFAEYVCAPARAFAPKPAHVSFEEAATVPHSAVLAVQALRATGPVRPGHTVLVNGAGGCVGPFAVQIAKAHGAEVTAVDVSTKLDFLHRLGADHVVDARQDITKADRRYEHIVDIAGNRSVRHYRRILQPRGGYALIAGSISGFLSAAIVGAILTAGSQQRLGTFAWKPNDADDLATLARMLEQGRIAAPIDRGFALPDTADAFRYLQSGRARGKVLITPTAADPGQNS